MRRRNLGILVISLMILFGIGVLFVGQEYSSSSKLMTVRVEGLPDAQSGKNMQDLMKMTEGIESFIFDQNVGFCTFRYDSSIINYKTIEAQFLALGLKITPIAPIEITSIISLPPEQKLLKVHFFQPTE